MAAKKSDAMKLLEKVAGGPLTFATMLRSIREAEDMSLAEFAARLSVSRSHLCDIEQGRKVVSVERAALWADLLGQSKKQFVRLALQSEVDRAGLNYKVAL